MSKPLSMTLDDHPELKKQAPWLKGAVEDLERQVREEAVRAQLKEDLMADRLDEIISDSDPKDLDRVRLIRELEQARRELGELREAVDARERGLQARIAELEAADCPRCGGSGIVEVCDGGDSHDEGCSCPAGVPWIISTTLDRAAAAARDVFYESTHTERLQWANNPAELCDKIALRIEALKETPDG